MKKIKPPKGGFFISRQAETNNFEKYLKFFFRSGLPFSN